jgi:CBS domain containing-hemolysin-like protein
MHLPLLAVTDWTQGLAPLLICVVVVLALSFLSSMVEAAFVSLPPTRAKAMEESLHPMERLAGRMRSEFVRGIAALVVLDNATDIAGSMFIGFVAQEYFEGLGLAESMSTAMAVFTAALTIVVIVVSKIVPKAIGESHSVAISKYAAVPIWVVQWLLTPVVWVSNLALRPFRRVGPHPTSEAEIAHLSTIAQEQGAIEEREEDMIHRVLKLNDIPVEQIMTPRAEMVSLQADQTLGEAAEELSQITRSLVPLWRKNRDDVVAILDRMDALLALARDKGDLPLSDPSISFKPFYVPGSMTADKLLVKLQRRTEHLAIVVGDYGETVGLATLEDVLEEVVGEIYDEEDIGIGSGIQRVSAQELVCLGAVEVKEVNAALGTVIPNHRSVAGLLLDEMERIPQKGEALERHGVRLAIEDANERAILKVRVTKLAEPAASSEGTDGAERT